MTMVGVDFSSLVAQVVYLAEICGLTAAWRCPVSMIHQVNGMNSSNDIVPVWLLLLALINLSGLRAVGCNTTLNMRGWTCNRRHGANRCIARRIMLITHLWKLPFKQTQKAGDFCDGIELYGATWNGVCWHLALDKRGQKQLFTGRCYA